MGKHIAKSGSLTFIFKLIFSLLILQHIPKPTSILHLASSALPGLILLKIIISPYHFLVLLDYFLVICNPSHCSLGFNLHINHIIMLFTIFSNRYILSAYCLVVLLVFSGLWCGFLYLLFLSPTLSFVFWLLFDSLCCWYSIIHFRSFLGHLLDS